MHTGVWSWPFFTVADAPGSVWLTSFLRFMRGSSDMVWSNGTQKTWVDALALTLLFLVVLFLPLLESSAEASAGGAVNERTTRGPLIAGTHSNVKSCLRLLQPVVTMPCTTKPRVGGTISNVQNGLKPGSSSYASTLPGVVCCSPRRCT